MAASTVFAFIDRLQAAVESPNIPYRSIILQLTVGVFIFESYVTLRQIPRLKLTSIPPSLSTYFSLSKTIPPAPTQDEKPSTTSTQNDSPTTSAPEKKLEQKPLDLLLTSQSYSLAKLRFGLFKNVVSLVESVLMITGLLAPFFASKGEEGRWTGFKGIWDLSGKLGGDGKGIIVQSLYFIVATSVISSITSIPFSLYSTFVVEEKFGFNKTTLKTWITDLLKSYALGAGLGLPLTAGLLYIIDWAGQVWIWYCMGAILIVQLIFLVLTPYLIAPLFNTYKPLSSFTDEKHKELAEKIEKLAGRLKFPLGKVWVVDASLRSAHSNAFFYGLPLMSQHIVIYDTLLKQSTVEEVEAVLAHELGHWKMAHPLLLFLISQVHLLTTLLPFALFIRNPSLFSSFGFTSAPYPTLIGFLLASSLSTPMDVLVTFGMHGLSRKLEFQADEFAKGLDVRYGERLGTALVTLAKENKSVTDVDWLYSAFHYTHPTVPERLSRLLGKKDL